MGYVWVSQVKGVVRGVVVVLKGKVDKCKMYERIIMPFVLTSICKFEKRRRG